MVKELRAFVIGSEFGRDLCEITPDFTEMVSRKIKFEIKIT
tara:strand:- start:437 stop:559 length:123 start_codon:yes stop_codon:yes gene_type:complete